MKFILTQNRNTRYQLMRLYSVTLHAQRQLRLNEAISVEFEINGTVVCQTFTFGPVTNTLI